MDAHVGSLGTFLGVTPGQGYAGGRSGGVQADAAREQSMDEAGLAEIYSRYSPAIYAHCRRLLGSSAAARDATQEAFVRVLAKGPKLLQGEDALRYVYRVATNVCLNLLREQKVHDRAAPALIARSSVGQTSEGAHADRQFAAALLDRCDDTGTSIAVMHYVDEMTQVEIAKTLGITRRTVFNRLKKIEGIARDLVGLRAAGKDQGSQETNEDANDKPESEVQDRGEGSGS